MPEYPEIVNRAIESHVTDIGQLTAKEKRQLNYWAKKGVLAKVMDWHYPIWKPMWIENTMGGLLNRKGIER
jgi:hypothetical protein